MKSISFHITVKQRQRDLEMELDEKIQQTDDSVSAWKPEASGKLSFTH